MSGQMHQWIVCYNKLNGVFCSDDGDDKDVELYLWVALVCCNKLNGVFYSDSDDKHVMSYICKACFCHIYRS